MAQLDTVAHIIGSLVILLLILASVASVTVKYLNKRNSAYEKTRRYLKRQYLEDYPPHYPF